jgi:hypothetical protein
MIWLLDYFSEHFDFSFSAKINLAQTKELEVGTVCGLIPPEMTGGCKYSVCISILGLNHYIESSYIWKAYSDFLGGHGVACWILE